MGNDKLNLLVLSLFLSCSVLIPYSAVENDGEVEVQIYLNCSHCHSDNCKRDPDTNLPVCQCEMGAVLANDNVTCTGKIQFYPNWIMNVSFAVSLFLAFVFIYNYPVLKIPDVLSLYAELHVCHHI